MSNFQNLVCFNNDFDKNNLYYFDFNDNTWLQCKPIGKLPYNLCKYKFENSDSTFITCNDSYRLTNNLDNILSNNEMYKEKEWRDNIVKNNEEIDLYSDGEWHKMIVAWIKADIIPDVLHLKKRRNKSNLCGYFYKESKNLAKSCTHTPAITEEELQKEKEIDEKAIKYREEKHKKFDEIEKSLIMYKIKEEYYPRYSSTIKDFFFYDTLPYYQTLKLNNDKKLIPKEEFKGPVKYEDYLTYDNPTKCMALLAFHLNKKTADIVSIEDEYDIKNSCIALKKNYDAFCNIKIYNATYAKLKSDNVNIDFDIIDSSDDNKIFGFKDINEANPIFNSVLTDNLFIETDGDKVKFDGILMDPISRLIIKCCQNFTVIHFPSKNFVLLHNTFIWCSMTFNYERLEETTNSSYRLKRF